MPDYRRAWHPGGAYFFTFNLPQRLCWHGMLACCATPCALCGDTTPLRFTARYLTYGAMPYGYCALLHVLE